ncbi:hypothetical protein NEOLEDRAFT_1245341, partial [Neolentinus lepideus HHB14362 ss-1]
MKHFFSLVVIFGVVASTGFQATAAPVEARAPVLSDDLEWWGREKDLHSSIGSSTEAASTSIATSSIPVVIRDPYKRREDLPRKLHLPPLLL